MATLSVKHHSCHSCDIRSPQQFAATYQGANDAGCNGTPSDSMQQKTRMAGGFHGFAGLDGMALDVYLVPAA